MWEGGRIKAGGKRQIDTAAVRKPCEVLDLKDEIT